MNDKKWSNYQIDIFNAIKNSNKNIIVNAVAGSGKTTTIVEACKRLKLLPNKVQFLAFNKSIANELSEKLKGYAQVNTLHSFGDAVLRQAFKGKRSIIDDKKYIRLLQNNICDWSKYINHEEMSNVEIYNSCCQIKKIFDLARVNLVKYGDIESLRGICDAYGICDEFDELEIVNLLLKDCYKMSDSRVIDFTDMVVLPLSYRTYISTFKFVFIDECQDLNAAQRELMLCAAKGGRFIAVGDRKQAINGFTGADERSLDEIAKVGNTKELPLSVNYRCGKEMINIAREIVPQIQACPNAIEGVVTNVSQIDLSLFKKNDMVLCRKCAPLVNLCLALIKNGQTATIKGNDLANELKQMALNIKGNTIEDVKEYTTKELDNLKNYFISAYGMDESSAKDTRPYLMLLDKCECLLYLAESANGNIKAIIDKVFSETKIANAITLMSIHKAKGLESDRVVFLEPNLHAKKSKKQKQWQFDQEQNLQYVAVTRAKKELVLCATSTLPKEKKK